MLDLQGSFQKATQGQMLVSFTPQEFWRVLSNSAPDYGKDATPINETVLLWGI